MHSLDTAIRLVVIGQQMLLALVFLFGDGRKSARLSAALLLAGVIGYLFISDVTLRESLPALLPLASLLSVAVPYCLWAFAWSVFDAPRPAQWLLVPAIAAGLLAWIVFLAAERIDQALLAATYAGIRIVSLLIVLHVLWLAASGRPDDLLEKRREFRVVFVVLISLQAIAVLLVELLLGIAEPPAWLSMLNVILIAVMTTGLALSLLRLNENFFPERLPSAGPDTNGQRSLNAAERVLYNKLLASMSSKSYRQSGLTISVLADELGYPQHQLRRLINQHLGYRNFSAFLNSYRIADAKAHLGDPGKARIPVLTIALDLGYGSLGPFNRAFKDATGMTPTAFREQAIPSAGADSD